MSCDLASLPILILLTVGCSQFLLDVLSLHWSRGRALYFLWHQRMVYWSRLGVAAGADIRWQASWRHRTRERKIQMVGDREPFAFPDSSQKISFPTYYVISCHIMIIIWHFWWWKPREVSAFLVAAVLPSKLIIKCYCFATQCRTYLSSVYPFIISGLFVHVGKD